MMTFQKKEVTRDIQAIFQQSNMGLQRTFLTILSIPVNLLIISQGEQSGQLNHLLSQSMFSSKFQKHREEESCNLLKTISSREYS